MSLKNTHESLCFKLKAYLGTKELDAEMGNMIEALHEVEADFDNVYGEHDSRELRTLLGFRVYILGFRVQELRVAGCR